MTTIGRTIAGALFAVGRSVRSVYRLIHEGDDDIRGTYPELFRPTGAQMATQASVTMNMTGLGNAGL